MRADRNKVFLPIGGIPLLVHTLRIFQRSPLIDEILLVAHPQECDACSRDIVQRYAISKVQVVVAGGATRHQSEERALAALRPAIERGEIGLVLIHDGARPFLAGDELARVVTAARETGGAILAAPLAPDDMIIQLGDNGNVESAVVTTDLARAQTPQAFDARRLLHAYDAARAASFEGTDTAAAFERLGYPVAAIPGSAHNIKVTTPDDLLRAEVLLGEQAPASPG